MIWFALALLIVVIAAALLIWILLEARAIRHHAGRALAAVDEVQRRTTALPAILAISNALDVGNAAVDEIAVHATALRAALPDGNGTGGGS
ncbi:MAG: hypothetical protein ABIP94_11955 [Planctomycetota bacterium]